MRLPSLGLELLITTEIADQENRSALAAATSLFLECSIARSCSSTGDVGGEVKSTSCCSGIRFFLGDGVCSERGDLITSASPAILTLFLANCAFNLRKISS